tara:strand:- start:610 stop:1155 length:546 start_codon:yes stop_codon:yes gene_type:complete
MENKSLKNKINKISLIISDVDGVLTDGTIFIGADGTEFKQFNVEDGTGAAFARLASIPIVLISGRKSDATSIRAKELKIKHCFQGSLDKTTPYKEVCKIYNVKPENIAYIGDGLIDVPVMLLSGLAIAPKNAHQPVKDISDYITNKSGGEGVLREVVELILKQQGIYNQTLEKMKKKVYKT